MAGHTPGPWLLWSADPQTPSMVLHPEKPGVAIANLGSVFYPENHYVGDEERSQGKLGWTDERTANAHLIAASPVLLQAAKKVWERRSYYTAITKDPYSPLGVALIGLKQAIDNAEGRS